MQFQTIKLTKMNEGKRLDTYLAKKLKLSRNQIQQLIQRGNIKINSEISKKTGIKLKAGDTIAYRLPSPAKKHEAEEIPLKIIYEDKNLLVIDKSAGIVVHPDGTGHNNGTIVNAILAHIPKITALGQKHRPGIIHRLDKDTSGILLIAKTQTALTKYPKLFQDRKVEKTYIALVKGHPKTKEGRIEASIKRSTRDRKQMSISAQGKQALSTFKVKENFQKKGLTASLLEVKIETGRTHQIRLHLASIGHPVLGDEKYGSKSENKILRDEYGLNRQFLHAKELKIDGKVFKSNLAEDLQKVLDRF